MVCATKLKDLINLLRIGVIELNTNCYESKVLFPPKYRELLQLAVAAQIPCQYCIYFHTSVAKAFGATDEDIHEAIAKGEQIRHWRSIYAKQVNRKTP